MQASRSAPQAGPIVWFAVAALLVIVGIPLLFVVLQAIFPKIGQGSLTEPFSRFVAALADPSLIRLTGNTLGLGATVMLTVAVLAIPLGVLRALFRVPLAPFWDFAFLLPFLIPPYIATLGWILTLQPRGYLSQLIGVHAGPFLFSFSGIAFVMTLHIFPVVYFAVSRTIAAVGGRYGDVARVFGATPLRAFFRITLPLAAPGLAASFLLVFAMTIEEYGTPAALGRQAGFAVLVTGIDTRLADFPVDLPGAAILSLILVALSLCAFAVQLRVLSGRSFETTTGKPQATEQRSLGAFTIPVVLVFALAAILAAVVPLSAIGATALSRTLSGGLALDNLGFQNFARIIDNGTGGLNALGNSLMLAVATALVTGLLGAAASYGVVKTRFRGKTLLDALTVLPNAIPGVVIAVGLILAWNQPALPITPYNTPMILLLAYCCLLLPYPVRYTNAALRQVGENLEAAARVAGATPLIAFRRVVLPLILPSLIAAMLLVFAVASRELVASLLVAPVGMLTIGSFIWQQFEQGSVGVGMAMSAIAIAITTSIPLAVMLTARRLGIAL
jgi:iron(III) transport system permease protein